MDNDYKHRKKRCLCHIAIVTLEANCEAKSSRSSAAIWHCQHPPEQLNSYQSSFFFNAPAARKLRVLTRIFTTIFIFRQMTPSDTSGWLRKGRPRKLTQEPYHLLLHALANCSDSVSKVTLPVEVITKTAIPNEARTLGTRAN